MPKQARRGTAQSRVNQADATLQTVLNRLDDPAQGKELAYDTETSGLSWREHHVVGHVVTFGPRPDASYYVPFRHGGGGNVGGLSGPQTPTGWNGKLAPGEQALLDRVFRPGRRIVGHNLAFDLKFDYRLIGEQAFEPQFEDTMINAPLINEFGGKFSLEACANRWGVQAKKGAEMVAYLRSLFPEIKSDREAMGHYWRLSGDDAMGVGYAIGDGTTTWQLRDAQMVDIRKPVEYRRVKGEPQYTTLEKVWDVESRLIRVLARMTCKGIKVDVGYFEALRDKLNTQISDLMQEFPDPENASAQSPSDVRWYMEKHGVTDWPMTPKTNKPSFPESWLKLSEPGRRIVAMRQVFHMRNSFITPLLEEHIWNGRVHANFNQLRGDDYGTIIGRLSSDSPNLQQAHKRDPVRGRMLRTGFIPDDGMVFAEADYRQCLVAGTKVMVPGGTKNIEDMQPGDLVYSYDNSRRLVLRKVTWAGQTGVRSVFRLKWKTNGRTQGHLDVTPDHKIRLIDGTYKTVYELTEAGPNGKNSPYHIRVMALRRGVHTIRDQERRNYLYPTGTTRYKESRLVFEEAYGWSPQEVHHRDENSLNDAPGNLEGLTFKEHRTLHKPFGMGKLSSEERKARSQIATDGLQKKFRLINNHFITHIVPLSNAVPVYDITVEDTHNFIANEICVHNCEPVLLAYYSRCKVLLNGFRAVPPVDAHAAVTRAMNLHRGYDDWDDAQKKAARENGKRINQTLITGGGQGVIVEKYDADPNEVAKQYRDYFRAMPEIKDAQRNMSSVFRSRGYMVTLLGRRLHMPVSAKHRDMSYVALNRILAGGNADVLKLKVVEMDDYLESEKKRGKRPPIDLLNNIHDAVDFQFAPEARKVYDRCIEIMQQFGPDDVIHLDVPLGVDHDIGKNWAIATFGEKK